MSRWRIVPVAVAVVAVAALGMTGPSASATTRATATSTSRVVPTHAALPAGGSTAVGAGIDAANQNAQLSESVPATVKPSWSREAPLCPWAAGASASSISVTGRYTVVDEVTYGCTYVTAYSTTTGAVHWRKTFASAYSTTVSGDTAFVLHSNDAGETLVDAITVSTGKTRWSKPQGSAYGRTETVGSGLVANSESVLDASTGAPAFQLPLGPSVTTGGTTLISGGRIFYNSLTAVEAFSPSGRSLWVRAKPGGNSVLGAGAGEATPALHGGLLYVRSSEETPSGTTLVLDPATGAVVRTLPRSDTDWSFDGGVGFATTAGTYGVPTRVSAVALGSGKAYWTHSFPMNEQNPFGPESTPVVENGLLWMTVASDSGSPTEIVALDEISGSVKTDFSNACPTAEGNLVVAQHRLFISSDCGIQTFVPSATPPVVVAPAGELLPDPGFERSTAGWTPIGAGVLGSSTTAHAGAHALRVTPTAVAPSTVGVEYDGVVARAATASSYAASCWIRPTKAGLRIGMDLEERPEGTSVGALPKGSEVPSLAVGVWTLMTTTGYERGDGDGLALRLWAENASAATGPLVVDDCSVTKQPS